MVPQTWYMPAVAAAVGRLVDSRWTAATLELVGLNRVLPVRRSKWSMLAEGVVSKRVPTRRTYAKSFVPELISVVPAPYGACAHFAGLPGQDLRQWQAASGKLASAIGVPVVGVGESEPGVFELQLRAVDPLEHRYQLPSVPAARTWALGLGVDEIGAHRALALSNVSGVVLGGVPGSGKSAWLTSTLATFSASPAVQFVVVDGKGGHDLACLRPRSCRFLNDDLDLEGIAAILKDTTSLVRERIRGSYELFGSSNFWDRGPTPRAPLVFVVVDECQTFLDPRQLVTKDKKAIGSEIHAAISYLVRKGRSAGVVTILSTQKPTAESLPTDIRDNASLRVCFGVQSTYAATAVLGDDWRGDSDASPLGAASGLGVAYVDGQFRRFRAPFVAESAVAAYTHHYSGLLRDPWQLLGPASTTGARTS